MESKSKQMNLGFCHCTLMNENCCDEKCENRLSKIECDDSICHWTNQCTNRRFQKREWCKCEIRKTKKKGFGLFSLQKIKCGDFVTEYVGEIIDMEECQKRLKKTEYQRRNKCYIIELEKNLFIDATKKGNIGRFVNHSCDPNCQTSKWFRL
ncbi:hypothetical protein RFI_00145 [Reticulomyxa filosa]|uniref:SET domain-containing protein n=1 Tax=Reticulomyxa filosa TaxID=46433 RepID=X6PFR0_RETFI|nr:hypothetical protein RFI_00145 [Reticulomyxa filosa]|eukprot:ETO36918.1 hypothetical protein RFI_00145 [Reticulomyxa filosa]